jgi:hypothetical protein
MPHCARYKGGIEAVRRVISRGKSSGFSFCVKIKRPDLLLENLVLNAKWQHLFDENLKTKARENLAGI